MAKKAAKIDTAAPPAGHNVQSEREQFEEQSGDELISGGDPFEGAEQREAAE